MPEALTNKFGKSQYKRTGNQPFIRSRSLI
jgi:hypothetical protein